MKIELLEQSIDNQEPPVQAEADDENFEDATMVDENEDHGEINGNNGSLNATVNHRHAVEVDLVTVDLDSENEDKPTVKAESNNENPNESADLQLIVFDPNEENHTECRNTCRAGS